MADNDHRADIVARARRRIGVRFRFQGRDASGLDCVGLVADAYQFCNVPNDYPLRAHDSAEIFRLMDRYLHRASAPLAPADVLVFQAGPAQLHLGLWSGSGLIHADAGLRRVVETPGPSAWPILGQWRQAEAA